MRRCCLLFIVILSTTVLTSCGRVSFYSHVADPENCNMNPTLAREWPSPDGSRKAVEQHFDCPGWYSLEIDLIGSDGRTKTTAFTDRPVDQVRPNRWPDLRVEWKSEHELWITYPPRQDTVCASNAGGVTVHCLDRAVRKS